LKNIPNEKVKRKTHAKVMGVFNLSAASGNDTTETRGNWEKRYNRSHTPSAAINPSTPQMISLNRISVLDVH
jgi:hypothetical protein